MEIKTNNIACRIFKEQIELIQQLPENERAEVLYKAIISAFNQFDNQIENQNENAYVSVSVSDSVSVLGKTVYELLRKNIQWKEFSNNYGGKRIGAGKKKQTESVIGSVYESDTDTTIKENIIKEEKTTEPKLSTDVIHMLGNSYKAVDAVIVAGKTPTGKTYEGIQIKNKRLLEFVKKRFNKNIIQKASDWAIDHQQHGYTYNASRLLKLLCKFQRDYEPAINYNFVQAEYLGFEPETNRSTPVKTA